MAVNFKEMGRDRLNRAGRGSSDTAVREAAAALGAPPMEMPPVGAVVQPLRVVTHDAAGQTHLVSASAEGALPPLEAMGSEVPTVDRSEIRMLQWLGRKYFNPERQSELADSIRQHGIIQPVLLRPTTATFDPKIKYDLVFGYSRVNAADAAGLTKIPYTLRDIDDATALALSLVENLQRSTPDPISLGEAFKDLRDKMSAMPRTTTEPAPSGPRGKGRPPSKTMTWDDVAAVVGITPRSMQRYIRLLELPSDKQEAIKERGLSIEHGIALATLNDKPQQQGRLLGEIERNELSGFNAIQRARELAGRLPAPAPKSKKSETAFDVRDVVGEDSQPVPAPPLQPTISAVRYNLLDSLRPATSLVAEAARRAGEISVTPDYRRAVVDELDLMLGHINAVRAAVTGDSNGE